MTSDPDQIREQIEQTRTSLSEDVNTLADTVNPAHLAKRKAASARSAVRGVKSMGPAQEVRLQHEGRRRKGVSGAGEDIGGPGHDVSGAGPTAPAGGG
jgi:hypothetical protein